MKILILCNKSPYPPKEGGSMGMFAMITGLYKSGHEVKVLSMNTSKFHVDPSLLPEEYARATQTEYIDLNLSIHPVKAFLNLFGNKSLHIERFDSKPFHRRLAQILRENDFDIVQLEFLYMSPYIKTIRKHSRAKIVLRSHNIEHQIWERIAANTKNPVRKMYLKLLAGRLKQYEIAMIREYDGIITVSKIDSAFYLSHNFSKPLTDVTYVIDLAEYSVSGEHDFPSLFHIGSMNWIPNEEGIRWFLEQVWPGIRSKHPGLKLFLAGRLMPGWLLQYDDPAVVVVGEVEDAKKFISSMSVMIAPLFSGGGIRIKIIEGMALGKAIVSTGVGAEGIPCENGKNILIANTPGEFADAVSLCVMNRSLCDNLGNNARRLMEQEFDRQVIIDRLNAFYGRIMKN
ncbi:MAG: glycosyltransferase [Bacteroidales bacterium]|nr:glycosyltransferase [Bacteroidales bacterium]